MIGTILYGLWNSLVPPGNMSQIPNVLPGQDLPLGRHNPVSPVPAFELQVTGDPLSGDDCVPDPPNSDQRSTISNFGQSSREVLHYFYYYPV